MPSIYPTLPPIFGRFGGYLAFQLGNSTGAWNPVVPLGKFLGGNAETACNVRY